MKKTIGLLTALALTACGQVPQVAFEDGLPGKDATTVTLPEQQGQPLTAAGSEGEGSFLFAFTVGASLVVNGSTAWALAVLGAVVQGEPTSINGDVAVFGPHTPALSRTSWRLTMTRTAPNAFSYVLEGKEKGADDSTYVTALSGHHTVAIDEEGRAMKGYGEGSYLIAWDKVTTLPGSPQKQGHAEVRYARQSPTAAVRVELDVEDSSVASGKTSTLSYRYSQVPGGEGSFEWAADHDIHWWTFDPTLSAQERWTIKSRWLADGEGRADVRATGGDLTEPVTVNECWNERFRTTFLLDATRPSASFGVEADACAIQGASYVQE